MESCEALALGKSGISEHGECFNLPPSQTKDIGHRHGLGQELEKGELYMEDWMACHLEESDEQPRLVDNACCWGRKECH